jgi:Tetratricopeptide repeat
MANLALTYRNQGQWKEAEGLEVQVMKMNLRVLGAEHPARYTDKHGKPCINIQGSGTVEGG